MWAQGGSRDILNKIVRYYFDAKEDFRLAAHRSGGDQRTELDKLVDEREQFHMQLQESLSRFGVEPSDNGTGAADMKRDWERVRGAVAGHGLDHALQLANQSDGHALQQIGLLLDRDLPPEVKQLLEQHSDAIRAARTKVHEWCKDCT